MRLGRNKTERDSFANYERRHAPSPKQDNVMRPTAKSN